MGSSRTRSHQLDNTLLKLMGHDDKKEKLHTDLCHFKVNRAVYTPRGALRCAPPPNFSQQIDAEGRKATLYDKFYDWDTGQEKGNICPVCKDSCQSIVSILS